MNPRFRRLVFGLFIVLWLLLLSIPFFSFSLAARTQLQLGSAEGNHARVFLIQENDAEGIGVEIGLQSTIDQACQQTNVRYFMWVGAAENATFCQCQDEDTGYTQPAIPGKCPDK